MTSEELYHILKPAQEKRGFYFNTDQTWTSDVLEGLLINKQRYGYGSCPCRLSTGDKARDRAIICPCVFREDDVKNYGRCYCHLYVSQEVAAGKRRPAEAVPERWLRD